MKNGKYCNGKKSLNMKPLAVLLALTLLVGCAIGGTLAWLTAQTPEVTNTFTVGNIDITLTETDTENNAKNYDFVPGDKLAKDPVVTVNADSEDCYLFVKVTVANNTNGNVKIVNWNIRDLDAEDGWKTYTPKSTVPEGVNYYYREVTKSDADQPFYILAGEGTEEYAGGFVTISDQVTKDMVTALTNNPPSLKFDAAAVQIDNIVATEGKTVVDVAFDQVTW